MLDPKDKVLDQPPEPPARGDRLEQLLERQTVLLERLVAKLAPEPAPVAVAPPEARTAEAIRREMRAERDERRALLLAEMDSWPEATSPEAADERFASFLLRHGSALCCCDLDRAWRVARRSPDCVLHSGRAEHLLPPEAMWWAT